ncbi:transposase InsO family protein [Mucilaginibacter sp. UYNi724]
MIEDTDFDSLEELEDELLKYLVYYNWERPHQGINGKKPIDMVTLNKQIKIPDSITELLNSYNCYNCYTVPDVIANL